MSWDLLVDYELPVHLLEDVPSNNDMKISVHKVKHQVDVFVILGFDQSLKGHDVVMTLQLLEEHYLPESPLGVGSIVKSIEDLLERHDLLGELVDSLPDNSIGPLAQPHQ